MATDIEYDMHVGAVGAVIELTIRNKRTGALVDLTTAEVLEMWIKGPRGPTVKATATAPSPTNGKARYLTVAGDIQYHGEHEAQAFAAFADGSEFSSSTWSFRVGPNL